MYCSEAAFHFVTLRHPTISTVFTVAGREFMLFKSLYHMDELRHKTLKQGGYHSNYRLVVILMSCS